MRRFAPARREQPTDGVAPDRSVEPAGSKERAVIGTHDVRLALRALVAGGGRALDVGFGKRSSGDPQDGGTARGDGH